MSFIKVLAAAALGALTLSDSALAFSKPYIPHSPAPARKVITSSAKCEVVASGYSEVSNKKAIAAVTADAHAFICGKKKVKTAHAIATATAEAFALAVASASADCEAQGHANFKVAASSKAKAAANVWVAAYASAFASAGDCDKCSAYAASYGYVEKEVFLKAVAQAEIKLEGYVNGGHLALKVLDYQEELKVVVVTAFAEALAGAAKLKDKDGCLAWANAGGCIYHPEHPHTTLPNCGGQDNIAEFECSAGAVSIGLIQEIDAIATASAKATAWTCGKSVSIIDLELTASALAEATAVAISYAYAECEVDGGFACAHAATKIEETAYAVAEAYATLWAKSIRCKRKCKVEVDVVVEAVGSILVKAASEAYAAGCSSGGHWTVPSLAIDIKKASLCALAEVSAHVISGHPSKCLISGIIYADASRSSCPAH